MGEKDDQGNRTRSNGNISDRIRSGGELYSAQERSERFCRRRERNAHAAGRERRFHYPGAGERYGSRRERDCDGGERPGRYGHAHVQRSVPSGAAAAATVGYGLLAESTIATRSVAALTFTRSQLEGGKARE